MLVAAQQRPMEQAAWELPQINLKAHLGPTSEQLSTDCWQIFSQDCGSDAHFLGLVQESAGFPNREEWGRPAALKAIEFVLQLLKLPTPRVRPHTGHNQQWPILENQSYTIV